MTQAITFPILRLRTRTRQAGISGLSLACLASICHDWLRLCRVAFQRVPALRPNAVAFGSHPRYVASFAVLPMPLAFHSHDARPVPIGRRENLREGRLLGHMDILTIVIIIILAIVILLMAGMLTTYSHDSMMTTANDARKRIRDERKSRYSIGMVILSNGTGSDVRWLRDKLAAYPQIRREQDEADWESRWLPRMRAYLDRIPQDAPSRGEADAFVENESALADDRELLATTEASIARMESSRFQMSMLTAFTQMAERMPAIRKSVSDARGRMAGITLSIDERTRHVADDANARTSGTAFHRYGDVRYFEDDDAMPTAGSDATDDKRNATRRDTGGNVQHSTPTSAGDSASRDVRNAGTASRHEASHSVGRGAADAVSASDSNSVASHSAAPVTASGSVSRPSRRGSSHRNAGGWK